MADGYLKFGAGGLQAFQADQMNEQVMRMRELAMDDQRIDIATKERQAQIQQEAGKYMSSLAKGQPAGGPPDEQTNTYADAFRQTAGRLIELGAPDQAMKYFEAAGKIDKQEVDLAKTQVDMQKGKAELLLKQSDAIGRIASTATNQQEFNQGIQELVDTGVMPAAQAQHLLNVPFDARSMKVLREKALSVKDQANLSLQQQQESRIQANADRTASIQMQRLAISKAQLAETKWKNRHNEKTGKAATAPTKADLDAAKTAVGNVVFDGELPSALKKAVAAEDESDPNYIAYMAGVQNIASAAKKKVRENKGIDYNTALTRATMESKNAGDWNLIEGEGFFSDDKVTFEGTGKSPEDALPIPTGKGGTPNTSSLKTGRWYISPDGKGVGKWNGKTFEVIQ